jgi:hypothetical protein
MASPNTFLVTDIGVAIRNRAECKVLQTSDPWCWTTHKCSTKTGPYKGALTPTELSKPALNGLWGLLNWEFHPIPGVFWSLDESNIYPRVGAPKQRMHVLPWRGLFTPVKNVASCPQKGCFLTWQSNVPFVVESRKLLSTPQTKGSHSTK